MKDRKKSSVFRLIRPFWGWAVLLNVLAFLQAVAQVALAVATKFVVDSAISGTGFRSWAVVLILLLLGIVALLGVGNWLTGSIYDRCVARMRRSILAAANRSREEQLQKFHSGALLSRGMEDVHTVCDGFVVAMPAMVGQIARLLGAFGAIVLMYPTIAPLLLVASLLIVGATAGLRPVLRKQHRRVREADERVMSQLQENLQQLELVKSLEMEAQTQNRFARWVKKSLAVRRVRRIWNVSIQSGLSLASQVGTGALLLWGAVQVASKALSYGALTAMLQLLSMLRNPVVALSGMWTRLSAIDVAAERLQVLLDQEPEETQDMEVGQVEAVVFENVSFHYPGDEAPVLEGFSARFPLDRWACLTGISGKGKSTIFKLILGLYSPQQGRVYLQTENGPVTCGKATRKLFAYVPQDYSLFSGTIQENLLLAAPDTTPEQHRKALQVAQADFVWELTAGDQTPVRENNTGLSKGQLQRLAIARAVLMDRRIFLLDECTSALDAQTENGLLEELGKLGKQAILVTHRPDALNDRDGVTFVNMGE